MREHREAGGWRARALASCGAAAIAALVGSQPAEAHFRLIAPDSAMTLDAQGNPQKMGPCGSESPQNPSNKIGTYAPGDTVTIQLAETVYHPGHYRVALAPTVAELPADPKVTMESGQCKTAAIQSPPVYPVLADGALAHTSAFKGEQTLQVKLPTNVTCSKCTLQVIEFMSEHPPSCFYYHCANIAIQGGTPDAGGSLDASRDASSNDAGAGAGGASGAAGGGGEGGASGGAGAAGSGGATAAGGATGTGGAGLGGAAGSAGSGGATTAGSGTAGASGDADSSGCSCRTAGARGPSPWAWLGLIAAVAVRRGRAIRSRAGGARLTGERGASR